MKETGFVSMEHEYIRRTLYRPGHREKKEKVVRKVICERNGERVGANKDGIQKSVGLFLHTVQCVH
jgi:hypothetical protein